MFSDHYKQRLISDGIQKPYRHAANGWPTVTEPDCRSKNSKDLKMTHHAPKSCTNLGCSCRVSSRSPPSHQISPLRAKTRPRSRDQTLPSKQIFSEQKSLADLTDHLLQQSGPNLIPRLHLPSMPRVLFSTKSPSKTFPHSTSNRSPSDAGPSTFQLGNRLNSSACVQQSGATIGYQPSAIQHKSRDNRSVILPSRERYHSFSSSSSSASKHAPVCSRGSASSMASSGSNSLSIDSSSLGGGYACESGPMKSTNTGRVAVKKSCHNAKVSKGFNRDKIALSPQSLSSDGRTRVRHKCGKSWQTLTGSLSMCTGEDYMFEGLLIL